MAIEVLFGIIIVSIILIFILFCKALSNKEDLSAMKNTLIKKECESKNELAELKKYIQNNCQSKEIEKIVYKEKPVEKIVTKTVEKIVPKIEYRDRVEYITKEVPVEKIVYKDKIVTNTVEKVVNIFLPTRKYFEKLFYIYSSICSGAKKMQRTPNVGRGYNILSVPNYEVTTYKFRKNDINKAGYIYIAKSEFTDCVKIGYTGRDIKHRISELNGVSLNNNSNWASSGAGTTFDWEYVYLFEASKDREDEDVHKYIKDNYPDAYRVQQGEMFKFSTAEAKSILMEYYCVKYAI